MIHIHTIHNFTVLFINYKFIQARIFAIITVVGTLFLFLFKLSIIRQTFLVRQPLVQFISQTTSVTVYVKYFMQPTIDKVLANLRKNYALERLFFKILNHFSKMLRKTTENRWKVNTASYEGIDFSYFIVNPKIIVLESWNRYQILTKDLFGYPRCQLWSIFRIDGDLGDRKLYRGYIRKFHVGRYAIDKALVNITDDNDK